jgi:mRNA interferase MazF
MPITTKIKNYKGNLVLHPNAENGLSQPSEVLSFHIRSISKERLKRRIGKIQKKELLGLIESLNDILRY